MVVRPKGVKSWSSWSSSSSYGKGIVGGYLLYGPSTIKRGVCSFSLFPVRGCGGLLIISTCCGSSSFYWSSPFSSSIPFNSFSTTSASLVRYYSFSQLPLTFPTAQALRTVLQYSHLTNVQERVLPNLLSRIIVQEKDRVIKQDHPQSYPIRTREDLLIQAPTGTGKTLLYLLYVIESLKNVDPSTSSKKEKEEFDPSFSSPSSRTDESYSAHILGEGEGAQALVIVPSRELALQIAQEAQKLYTYHHDFRIEVLCGGGPNRGKETQQMLKKRPQMIIATPGRLIDHFENSSISFLEYFQKLKFVIIDEADFLLNCTINTTSAYNELKAIFAIYLSPNHQNRITLLLSATLTKEIRDIATKVCCRGNFQFINCNPNDDDHDAHRPPPPSLHLQTKPIVSKILDISNHMQYPNQQVVTTDNIRNPPTTTTTTNTTEQLLSSRVGLITENSPTIVSRNSCAKDKDVYAIPSSIEQNIIHHRASETICVLKNFLEKEIQSNQYYKILVFFPTARQTAFFAGFFRDQFHIGVYEMHRRREVHQRESVSKKFYRNKTGIMFTTDVSARGMHYPDISLVLQVGAPLSNNLYLHRAGRTGRMGKYGKSILLLNEYENQFVHYLDNINDIHRHTIQDLTIITHHGSHSSLRDCENFHQNQNTTPITNCTTTTTTTSLDNIERLSKPMDRYTTFLSQISTQPITAINIDRSTITSAISSWLSNTALQHTAANCYASLLLHYRSLSPALLLSSDQVVEVTDSIMQSAGMSDKPPITKKFAISLNLEHHPKLNIVDENDDQHQEYMGFKITDY